MLGLQTFLAILLLTDIALELDRCGLVMSVAVRLRTESDLGVCEYLPISDDLGVLVLSLL